MAVVGVAVVGVVVVGVVVVGVVVVGVAVVGVVVVGVELYPDETTYSWVEVRTMETVFEPWRCRSHSLPEGRDWKEILL